MLVGCIVLFVKNVFDYLFYVFGSWLFSDVLLLYFVWFFMYVVCDGCYDMLLVVSGGSVFDFCCMVEVLYDCMLFDVFVLFFDDWCVVVVVLLL